MSKLSAFSADRAKRIYGEDESRRRQALAQFREWISKHPFIKRFNPTDTQLLAHLRACKYSMTNACQQLEKCLIFLKTHESWFRPTEEDHERAIQLYESGFLKLLKRRDNEGRRIVLITSHLGDPSKFNGDDVMNLNCLFFSLMLDDEDTQICGVNYINTTKNVTVNHIPLLSIKKTADILSHIKVFPISAKNIFIIGVPHFAMQLLDMMKYVLSEKLRNRFHVLNDFSELPEDISKIVQAADDMNEIENLRELVKIHPIDKYFEFEIDLLKATAKHKTFADVGSFRKLEID